MRKKKTVEITIGAFTVNVHHAQIEIQNSARIGVAGHLSSLVVCQLQTTFTVHEFNVYTSISMLIGACC